MARPHETCAACAFDAGEYDLRDTLNTLQALPAMWEQTTDGVKEDVLLTRPNLDVWSAAEYTAHSADVVEVMGRLLHGLLTFDDLEVEAVPERHAPDVSDGHDAAHRRLVTNVERLLARARRVTDDADWRRAATIAGDVVDGDWVIRHAVHDTTHHLMDIGRGLHALGAGAPTHTGSVAQLNVSDGGVPKLPVDAAEVTVRGVVGDRQDERKHHGRPLQALCLWSADVIADLQAEGHPIAPGLAGENVTVAGIDWSAVRPGVQLQIGSVLAEVSAWATPCAKNAGWFTDRYFNRMDHDRHPGSSRAYAWVRRPGTIRTGDPVIVEPGG